MSKALLIAWREISWEIFGDRGAILRMGIFAILPIVFVLTNRTNTMPPIAILTFAMQSVLFPALSGVALIASTFTQEKENGTLVPLLAAPIRDMDIVVGKLLGMIIPVMSISVGSLALYYALASATYGPADVGSALPPTMLFALIVLAFLYLLSAGSWVLIVAAVVRTSRAAQQISGLIIGLSVAIFVGFGFIGARYAGGNGLIALGVAFVIADVVALEIARRVWQRGEVIGHL